VTAENTENSRSQLLPGLSKQVINHSVCLGTTAWGSKLLGCYA